MMVGSSTRSRPSSCGGAAVRTRRRNSQCCALRPCSSNLLTLHCGHRHGVCRGAWMTSTRIFTELSRRCDRERCVAGECAGAVCATALFIPRWLPYCKFHPAQQSTTLPNSAQVVLATRQRARVAGRGGREYDPTAKTKPRLHARVGGRAARSSGRAVRRALGEPESLSNNEAWPSACSLHEGAHGAAWSGERARGTAAAGRSRDRACARGAGRTDGSRAAGAVIRGGTGACERGGVGCRPLHILRHGRARVFYARGRKLSVSTHLTD